jgi:type IV secretion system protein VirB6
MGFFAEFNAWLNTLLSTYIATNTSLIAAAIEPVVVTLAVIYVMIWGYLHLTGQIQEPFVTGVRRLITLAVILGLALNLWLYNQLIVDSFFNAPAQLDASIVGVYDPVGTVDQIIDSGSDTGGALLQKGGVLNGNFAFYLAGVAVYIIVGITAIYTIFLLSLSHIALSILLALGPVFIALTMFDTTKRFFESWIAQLSNYAFITVLTVLASALMLTVLSTAAQQALAQGGGISIAMAARVCMAAGLTFLVMRQVMPMASGLASGIALNTFGWMSLALAWGLGRGKHHSGDFLRGLRDRDTSRWDSFSRKAGYYTRAGLASGWRKAVTRDNHIRAA